MLQLATLISFVQGNIDASPHRLPEATLKPHELCNRVLHDVGYPSMAGYGTWVYLRAVQCSVA